MDENYTPSFHTLIFIGGFLFAYLAYLFRSTLKNRIDFYDYLMLGSVAILPSIFAFFPKATIRLTALIGVQYPFIILFGALFFVVFFYLNGLVMRVNRLTIRERQLSQEVALLRQKIESKK